MSNVDLLWNDIARHHDIKTVSSTGYHTIKCPMCNDDQVRAGFNNNGDSIIYNCFRGSCDANTVFNFEDGYMTHKFRNLMKEMHIQVPIDLLLSNDKRKALNTFNTELYEEHSYNKIELLQQFEKLDPEYDEDMIAYLYSRGIEDYSGFYAGTRDEWENRLIIPYYFYNTLIGWNSINFNDYGKKHLSSSGNTDMIYLPNKRIPKNPIIVEGEFDALCLPNGVGTQHSSISKKQAYFFRNSDPILLPDRSGSRYMESAERYGWRVSIPDWDCKDVDEAKSKYGIFLMAEMIYKGIEKDTYKAKVKYDMWRNK